MRKIYLLRHAEATSEFSAPDKDRRLTNFGKSQATEMGIILSQHQINHVLCSSAARTQETLKELQNAGAVFGEVKIIDELYNAPADILSIHIENTKGNVLLIAHNPGIHQLAFQMAQDGDDALINQLAMGYAPATLSIFENNRIIDLSLSV